MSVNEIPGNQNIRFFAYQSFDLFIFIGYVKL